MRTLPEGQPHIHIKVWESGVCLTHAPRICSCTYTSYAPTWSASSLKTDLLSASHSTILTYFGRKFKS